MGWEIKCGDLGAAGSSLLSFFQKGEVGVGEVLNYTTPNGEGRSAWEQLGRFSGELEVHAVQSDSSATVVR